MMRLAPSDRAAGPAVIRTSLDAFLRARQGLAAVEFALIAPIMLLLFFAIVEASAAYSASRRVSLAVNTLADLTSQETQITADQAEDLFVGMRQIVGASSSDLEVRLVSLIVDPESGQVRVHWSRDSNGAQPYSPGGSYTGSADASMLDASSSLIVGEITYRYESKLTRKLIPSVDFEKAASRWPRRSTRVQFCVTSGNCTT